MEGGWGKIYVCNQTTQKLERYKLVKMHSASPPPSLFLPSLVLSPHPLLLLILLLSITWRCGSLKFWVVVYSYKRLQQPYFLNGGVTDVNKAGWPSPSLPPSLYPSLPFSPVNQCWEDSSSLDQMIFHFAGDQCWNVTEYILTDALNSNFYFTWVFLFCSGSFLLVSLHQNFFFIYTFLM